MLITIRLKTAVPLITPRPTTRSAVSAEPTEQAETFRLSMISIKIKEGTVKGTSHRELNDYILKVELLSGETNTLVQIVRECLFILYLADKNCGI